MNIVVLIKQVPDMEKVKFDREKGVIDRKSAGTEINPFDLNALEAAVQLKDNDDSVHITALSMGPPSAESALKEALARGADEGILLSDKNFGGADTWATSMTLAAGIKKMESYDLIIAGMQTVDGDTGQVGPEVAELLDIPHVSYVSKVEEITDKLTAKVDIWDGTYLKEMQLPGLITVTKDINNPRLPSFKDKMRSRKAEIPVWGYNDIAESLNGEKIGIKGSPTVVKRIEVPKETQRKGKLWRDNIEEGIDELVDIFKEIKVVEG
ncbi:MAG: electron transfer flavoprotein subunit beta/FixA family protein [Bacillota bacterium]|nr:electron transfer flavoprotein subunit beta/FixA family protein [Bacillota bacterium]